MAQDRNIKYVDREFGDFRQQLIEYTKNYFPDTYNDFSPTSPGMMFMEMAAYVGDVLSFYQDIQLQETFLQYAKEPANLYTLAYMMGYKPKVTTVAEVVLEVTQRVGADPITSTPNWNQALTVSRNTVIRSDSAGSIPFLIDREIDFSFSSSYEPTEISIYSLDGNTGVPTEFLLKKRVKAVSSQIKTLTTTFTDSEKYYVELIAEWFSTQKSGQDAVVVLKKALDNVRPTLEVRSRRVGGSTYQVPVEVKPHRANTLALRWLSSYAKDRREKTMTERLTNEILDASNGLGAAVKRREDTHKMAESNKAFAHYRW